MAGRGAGVQKTAVGIFPSPVTREAGCGEERSGERVVPDFCWPGLTLRPSRWCTGTAQLPVRSMSGFVYVPEREVRPGAA